MQVVSPPWQYIASPAAEAAAGARDRLEGPDRPSGLPPPFTHTCINSPSGVGAPRLLYGLCLLLSAAPMCLARGRALPRSRPCGARCARTARPLANIGECSARAAGCCLLGLGIPTRGEGLAGGDSGAAPRSRPCGARCARTARPLAHPGNCCSVCSSGSGLLSLGVGHSCQRERDYYWHQRCRCCAPRLMCMCGGSRRAAEGQRGGRARAQPAARGAARGAARNALLHPTPSAASSR